MSGAIVASIIGVAGGALNSRGSTSTQSQRFDPPENTKPLWQSYLNNAQSLTGTPTPQYGGMQVAPLSPGQIYGTSQLQALSAQGSPLVNAGSNSLQGMLGGQANPYAMTMNPHASANPEMDAMIASSNHDIADAFGRGTAAQNDSAFARSRAFGGSAHNEMTNANAQTLGKTLANNTSNIRYQDYARQGDLMENQLNRSTNAWQQGQGNQLQAAGLAQGYQAGDINAINASMGAAGQQTAYQQALLDSGRNYFNQGVQDPYMRLGVQGTAAANASGNSYSSTATTPGGSPLANGLGTGLYAYGAMKPGGAASGLPSWLSSYFAAPQRAGDNSYDPSGPYGGP